MKISFVIECSCSGIAQSAAAHLSGEDLHLRCSLCGATAEKVSWISVNRRVFIDKEAAQEWKPTPAEAPPPPIQSTGIRHNNHGQKDAHCHLCFPQTWDIPYTEMGEQCPLCKPGKPQQEADWGKPLPDHLDRVDEQPRPDIKLPDAADA